MKQRLAQVENVWNRVVPGRKLWPKLNHVWKPLVGRCTVWRRVAAFYWINEADIVLCSDEATFFDPHVTYGMTQHWSRSALRAGSCWGRSGGWPDGLDERMPPAWVLEIGLVSEVLPRAELWKRAEEIAAAIAVKPPAAVQGTVWAIWESLDSSRTQALWTGLSYTQIGNPIGTAELDRATLTRPEWRLR